MVETSAASEATRDAERPAPLTPSVLHILLSLAAGERHGYAIMQEVREASGGRVRLGPGTLYYSIQRMLEKGLIEEAAERPAPEADDERRVYYRITDAGRTAAQVEASRLADLVTLARSRDILQDVGGPR